MNIQGIIADLANTDPELYDRLEHVSRRSMFTMIGRKAAQLAAPVVAMSAVSQAYGQALPQPIVDVLNFALTLEYLEAEYYNVGMDSPGLLTGTARTVYGQIQKHENAHVKLLKGALGSAAVAKPAFDFTAKGAFPNPFTNYAVYLTLSQAFEDTGVRAYKGQAPVLMPSDPILTTALRIHSVEAKHAARVRMLRGVKPWVTGNTSPGIPAAIYAGDESTVHLEISSIVPGVPLDNSTQAWDEPLSKEDVLKIVAPFIAAT
jgi:hypothetical protein